MILNAKDYTQKVLGCWMGKNIGGTLGAPFEWKRQINNVSFYTQDLHGEPLPNDDLDIQLLWLIAMEEKGIEIDSKLLGEYWMLYVTPHWSEYGNAKIHMKSGLMPPLSGMVHNDYKDSCGAFIRSEIWACIAPGCPEVAARYAYEDAMIDHGDGEGVYGEVFCAALESAAFVEKDVRKLIDIGLSYIPEGCGVAKAVRNAVDSYQSGLTWKEARDRMLKEYRGECFFGYLGTVSAEDQEKGFADGQKGWDVPSNIGMLIIGLLYGEGDFEQSMCITVNCGEDTDCTGATYGSIFGILHGIDAIPEKWKQPIGRKIKTACLNLGELGYFGNQLPADIDDLTERVKRIAHQVILRYKLPVAISKEWETDLSSFNSNRLFASQRFISIYEYMGSTVFSFDFFDVAVSYGNSPSIKSNVSKDIRVTIKNKYKIPDMLNLHWYLPEGWTISPAKEGKVFVSQEALGHSSKHLEFSLQAEHVHENINRCVLELTVEGRHTVMLVPIVLLNGNLTEV